MKIVSEQSEAELARQRAIGSLTYILRALTANLMRIARGAGRPERLTEQLAGSIAALDAYRAAVGYGIEPELVRTILDPDEAFAAARPWIAADKEAQERWAQDGTLDEEAAERDIRRAALQITASMLLNQMTQQRRGESDLAAAMRELRDIRQQRKARLNPAAPARKLTSQPAARPKAKKR